MRAAFGRLAVCAVPARALSVLAGLRVDLVHPVGAGRAGGPVVTELVDVVGVLAHRFVVFRPPVAAFRPAPAALPPVPAVLRPVLAALRPVAAVFLAGVERAVALRPRVAAPRRAEFCLGLPPVRERRRSVTFSMPEAGLVRPGTRSRALLTVPRILSSGDAFLLAMSNPFPLPRGRERQPSKRASSSSRRRASAEESAGAPAAGAGGSGRRRAARSRRSRPASAASSARPGTSQAARSTPSSRGVASTRAPYWPTSASFTSSF